MRGLCAAFFELVPFVEGEMVVMVSVSARTVRLRPLCAPPLTWCPARPGSLAAPERSAPPHAN
jgi:hypothetical protein